MGAMDWSILWQYRGALASGLVITLWVSALAIVGSTILGMLVGCLAVQRSYLLRRLTSVYTETLRNLPLIVKLFFLYFIVSLPAVPAALLALVLHQSAYIADVTRAGHPVDLARTSSRRDCRWATATRRSSATSFCHRRCASSCRR